MARTYKRDAGGRFAGGGGGGSTAGRGASSRPKASGKRGTGALKKTLKSAANLGAKGLVAAAKNPLTYQVGAGVALAVIGGSGSRQLDSAMGAARTKAQSRVANTSGIGAGSAMLKAARQNRRGVYKL